MNVDTIQYWLVLHIESPGTPTYSDQNESGTPDGSSVAGHIWYQVGNGVETISAGFAPGGVTNRDSLLYDGEPSYSSRIIPINESQFNTLREFGTAGSRLSEMNGFGANNYNVLDNSCVDYAWKALELAGLNPGKHQGSLLPMSNIDDLRKYMSLSKEEARVIDEQIAEVLKYTYDPEANEWGRPLEDMLKTWEQLRLPSTVDPLILDLDGDGVETLSVKDGVHFNLDCNGLREAVGWVSPDDGLLVQDLDGDGRITSGAELFGNFSMTSSAQLATQGFQALAMYDTNGDRYVDGDDENFNRLQVWRDLNSNGISEDGELMSLEDAGVQRLSLSYSYPWRTDAAGNHHRESSFYVRSDGTTRTLTDVWFATEMHRTLDTQPALAVSAAIAAMPDIAGLGNVRSLHQTLARDTSGALMAAVQAWQRSDGLSREALTDELVQTWAGTRSATALAAGSVLNGAQLAALEGFMGQGLPSFNRGAALQEVNTRFSNAVKNAYLQLTSAIHDQLATQTDLPVLLSGLQMHSVNERLSWDVTPMLNTLGERFASALDRTDALFDLASNLTQLRSAGMGYLADGVIERAAEWGPEFQQTAALWGRASPIVRGSASDDTLYSPYDRNAALPYGDASILYGGRGNDYYFCRSKNDLVFFRPGDGHDVLNLEDWSYDKARQDVLAFDHGIRTEQVTFERIQNDLVIRLSDLDSVTVSRYFYSPCYRLEEIRFSDGTAWSDADIAERLTMVGSDQRDHWVGWRDCSNRIQGRGGDDELYGGDKADMLHGNEGRDWLHGLSGNDILVGGPGNDHLKGGFGDDVYVFSMGDGRDAIYENVGTVSPHGGVDTLRFTEGITLESLQLARSGSDLIVGYGSCGDAVTVYQQFQNSAYQVERIELADGSWYTIDALLMQPPPTAVLAA